MDVIRRLFEEDDKNNPTEAPTTTTTPPPPANGAFAPPALQPDDSAQAEEDPEFFHLRFNQANNFALDVNDAANNLLKITDTVKVSKTVKNNNNRLSKPFLSYQNVI